ncbi:MAG: hypothetical protein AAFW68_03055 [Pseudomonadota bacterium]
MMIRITNVLQHLLRWSIFLISTDAVREEVLNDLEEGYIKIKHAAGHASAEQWYLRQAFSSLPDLLIYRLQSTAHIRATAGVVLGWAAAFVAAVLVGITTELFIENPLASETPLYLVLLVTMACAFASALAGGYVCLLTTRRPNYLVMALIGAFVLTPDFVFAIQSNEIDVFVLPLPIIAIILGLTLSEKLSTHSGRRLL